ncbi:unnamed protein product [Dicrocoelium dendriticum]|nr:unnamed protein product [Dicrocoelium dendriticum]
MKTFMSVESQVCDLPLSYARVTTDARFCEKQLAQFFSVLGILNLGLWKYEYRSNRSIASWDSVNSPGDELHLFSALWTVRASDSTEEPCTKFSSLSHSAVVSYEDALLRAYVLPTEAVLLSIPPTIHMPTPSELHTNSLVTVWLNNWASYYIWRGLCRPPDGLVNTSWSEFSSPLAILLHWPMTVYYIVAEVLPRTSPHTVSSVLSKRTLTIHLIGVEHELSMLPVFQELDYLLRPGLLVTFFFIGMHIDPTVNRKTFYLSNRLSVAVWTGAYHDFVLEHMSADIRPDLIIGLNSGLSAYTSWTPTLKLIGAMGVPAYFTDACLYSCAWSFRVARSLGLRSDDYKPDCGPVLDTQDLTGINAPILNPFRSPLRMQPVGVRWGWFRNAFIFSPLRFDHSENSSTSFSDLLSQFDSLKVC